MVKAENPQDALEEKINLQIKSEEGNYTTLDKKRLTIPNTGWLQVLKNSILRNDEDGIQETGHVDEIDNPTLSSRVRKEILAHKESIVQQESNSTVPFSLVLWDLGGQNEFITTHHLFLDIDATTLVVMDINKGLHHHLEEKPKLGHPNTPAEVLSYWLTTIHSQALEKKVKPNIALVLTHKDMIQTLNMDQYIENYIQCIEKYIQGKKFAHYIT